MKKKFGQFLLSKGVINIDDFTEVLKVKKASGMKLGEALVANGYINEEQLLYLLGEFLGVKTVAMQEVTLVPELIEKVSKKIALQYKCVPVRLINQEEFYIAFYELVPDLVLENLRRILKVPIQPLLMSKVDNLYLLQKAYPEDFTETFEEEIEKLAGTSDKAVEIVDNILTKAIALRTSDIHLEPEIDGMKVRFRIDGILKVIEKLSLEIASSVTLRIKVLSNMNIADKRSPQDGGFKFEKTGEKGVSINLRVSTLPCSIGEKVVIRLLPTEANVLSLEDLGMGKEMLKNFHDILTLPHGIIFVTGPTGSGKTNTLYAALKFMRSDEVNITTVEDPIELDMSGINQSQIDSTNKFTFSKALRTILRQDPNVIMVGEVRDGETAALALEAALTGHLVLSTLHTNDATSAFGRLTDMGCEPFLIFSSVRAVLAQRLVRVLCPKCKEKYIPETVELLSLGLKKESDVIFFKPKGCGHCNGTGYKGRTGIFELFILDKEIQNEISREMDASSIRSLAIQKGMKTLRDDGIRKMLEGITSTTEILKATMEW